MRALATFLCACASAVRVPTSARDNVVDVLHGIPIADPYRWLEQPDSDRTRTWVAEQNRATQAFLAASPNRAAYAERLEALANYERWGLPVCTGARCFFHIQHGLQEQPVLYVRDADAAPRALLDPNQLSADGTVAVKGYSPSADGRLFAYATSEGGSDWLTWHVRDVEAGRDLPDMIRWSKFSGASWLPDGSGFYYGAYDAPAAGAELEGQNFFQKLYLHRLGTLQDADVLVYGRADQPRWGFDGTVTDDGRYLIITVWQGTDDNSLIFYSDLRAPAEVHPLVADWSAAYRFIGNHGSTLYFLTNHEAPRWRVLAKELDGSWRELIGESEHTLEDVALLGHTFVAQALHNATGLLILYDGAGRELSRPPLPGLGTVALARAEARATGVHFSYASVTAPASIHYLDLEAGPHPVFVPQSTFDESPYQTQQVFYPSKDGTLIPMFLVCRSPCQPRPDTPALLYGYGGFNISITPDYDWRTALWLEKGGLYAVPNLRGGGEFGQAWHDAGRRAHKQNVFDDFISAAEWLIAQGYTRHDKLAISGRSNGGLLVGASITQRPDLFGAALPAVGVHDMLRFHKFTIGWAWTDDYGSPDQQPDFEVLRAYSPLHNVREVAFPATLLTTADHDDRVVPAHSYKFAATLQAKQQGPAPVLIRVETRAGHGSGTPTSKRIEELVDVFAFLEQTIGFSS
jgi:prolyl oligopeptidase